MNAFLRTISKLVLAATLAFTAPACMSGSGIDVGAFPAANQDVDSEVTLEEARAVAEVAFQGLTEGDYAKWTTRWDESMTDAISPQAFQEQVHEPVSGNYGKFIAITDARVTEAQKEGYVRFTFVAEHEKKPLMMVHVYPKDGTKITGVGLGEPDGSPVDLE